MDEVLVRRLIGLLTLLVAAFLLSWLLPRPGLHRLQGEGERVVTMDLTRPDSLPEEILAPEAEAERPAPLPTPAVAPSAPPAPATQDSESEETPVAANSPQPAAQIETEIAPVPAEPLAPPSEPAIKPPPKPAPVVTAKPEPKPAPIAAEPRAPSGAMRVQAGAYSHLDKAEAVRGRAQGVGVSCVISPADTAKGTVYRVRCGPFANAEKAAAAVQALQSSGIQAQVVSGL